MSAVEPLVTVVVPVLNGATYLRQSLDSILGQTYPRLEVVVMDDASSDGTADVVRSYGNRLTYVRQPSTLGIYANANHGIARARGALVGVFHADDIYEPGLVGREVEWLRDHPEAGAVFCADVFIDAEGRELGRLELPPELRGNRALGYAEVLNALLEHKNSFLRCPTALVRKDVYDAVGTYRQDMFRNSSDLEQWLRIARRYPIGIVDDHLLRYRRGHGSSSERYHQMRTDTHRFFTIMDLELDGSGRAVARPEALRAYEAHRAEDTIMRAVNHYILGDRGSARVLLRDVELSVLFGTDRVQRGRLGALTVALRLLARLPRITALAGVFERRWYAARATEAGKLR